jgi:hypothetical protein
VKGGLKGLIQGKRLEGQHSKNGGAIFFSLPEKLRKLGRGRIGIPIFL